MPHLGPPTAPRRTASADCAAASAESVRAVLWASIEHYAGVRQVYGRKETGERYAADELVVEVKGHIRGVGSDDTESLRC